MVMRFLHYQFIFFFLLASQAYGKVSLTADRTVLHQNESINIEIIQSDVSGGSPDLNRLKKDFDILSQSQSQQYNMINGKTSQKKVWSLTLMPKRTGEIVIPSIQIGQEKSLPLHLVVKKAVKTTNNETEQVFMQVSIEPKSKAYVQQKIELIIKIFYRINLNNLALSDINIDNVILEKFGEDKQYTKAVKQHTYQVIERRYAIYPQKSGLMTIPSIRFEALVTTRNNSAGSWPFFSQRGKPIYKQSEAINLDILAKPDNYPGNVWLPAENIQVVSEHSDLSNINIGDSITITDKIIAKGLSGSVLSDIPFDKINGVKVYPDQAKVNSQERNGVLYGLREQKTALIPTRAGRFEIPARELVWWNTKTDRLETKIIPGIVFNVLPPQEDNLKAVPEKLVQTAPSAISSPAQEKELTQSQDAEDISSKTDSFTDIKSSTKEVELGKKLVTQLLSINNNIWFWIWCLSVFIFIITVWIILNKRKNTTDKFDDIDNEENNKPIASVLPQLLHEMKYDNPKKTYHLFILWMKNEVLNHKTDINDLSAFIPHKGLKKAFADLETFLFSTNKRYDSWKAKELHKAIKQFIKEKNKLNPGTIKIIPELN